MKKTLFVLLAVASVSSLCFAQQPAAPVTKTVPTPVVVKAFTGKVDSVSIGDPAKKISSKIVVIDDQGQKLSFTVKTTTDITVKDGKAITLGSIAKDNKVAIEYTTSQKGTNKAKSIKVVE